MLVTVPVHFDNMNGVNHGTVQVILNYTTEWQIRDGPCRSYQTTGELAQESTTRDLSIQFYPASYPYELRYLQLSENANDLLLYITNVVIL